MLTDDVLAEIEARAEAATPGRWEWCDDGDGGYVAVARDEVSVRAVLSSQRYGIGERADVEFAAHARQDIPALLAECRRLRAEVAELEQQIDSLHEEAKYSPT